MFSKNSVSLTFIYLSSVLYMDNLYQSYYVADDHLPGEHFYMEM
ncbi:MULTISPECIES: hypothetical protein [Bacillus]|nr:MULTISPECIES: hypothetical protein [Bacillus]